MSEEINSAVLGLKLKGVEIEKETFVALMCRHPNIYQIVYSKFSSDKKVRLIIKEI